MKTMTALILVLLSFTSLSAESDDANYFVGSGELADLSVVVEGSKSATIHVTFKDSNEPLVKAKIALQPANDPSKNVEFQETKDPGVYAAVLTELSQLPGQIIVQTDADTDVIEITVPPYKTSNAMVGTNKDEHNSRWKDIATGFGLGVFSLMGGFFGLRYYRTRSAHRAGILALSILASTLCFHPKTTYAHGGHDHGGDESSRDSTTSSGNEIVLAKSSQLLIGLKTTRVKKESAADVVTSFGHVIPKPQLDAMIIAPQSGFLRSSQSVTLGKKVKRGETLGYIQSVNQIRLESPIDGEVSEVHAADGARIDGGGKVFRVTDSSVLWVDAELFSSQLSKIKNAKDAYITLEDKSFYQTKILSQVTPISEETRTAKVFLEIVAQEVRPQIGTFVEVVFSIPGANEGFLVPNSSVLNRAGEKVVFVKTGPETFVPRTIFATESSIPGKVLVTKGLNDGDLVVTAGNYQLMMKAK